MAMATEGMYVLLQTSQGRCRGNVCVDVMRLGPVP